MELASPAVIAYWSALNHHGMTEQLPRTVFVATDHPVRRRPGEVLGVSYRIVSLKPGKFFGITKDWAEMHRVADREGLRFDRAEKDYVILWILSGLAHSGVTEQGWVFKGGTCRRC